MDSLSSFKYIPEKNHHVHRHGVGTKWPVTNLTYQLEAGNHTHGDATTWDVMAFVFSQLAVQPK